MANITKTTQLDIVDIIKTVLKTSAVLNRKFRDSSYYNFLPSLKSFSFSSLPIMVIRYPTTDTGILVMDHSQTLKSFDAEIEIMMDFSARNKFNTYVNAILATLEANESTFEASGYYGLKADLVDVGENVIQSKSVVTGIISVATQGGVAR